MNDNVRFFCLFFIETMLYLYSKESKEKVMSDENEFYASAKLTSKGQITIPKIVRDKMELEEGDRILFFLECS